MGQSRTELGTYGYFLCSFLDFLGLYVGETFDFNQSSNGGINKSLMRGQLHVLNRPFMTERKNILTPTVQMRLDLNFAISAAEIPA